MTLSPASGSQSSPSSEGSARIETDTGSPCDHGQDTGARGDGTQVPIGGASRLHADKGCGWCVSVKGAACAHATEMGKEPVGRLSTCREGEGQIARGENVEGSRE